MYFRGVKRFFLDLFKVFVIVRRFFTCACDLGFSLVFKYKSTTLLQLMLLIFEYVSFYQYFVFFLQICGRASCARASGSRSGTY